MASPQKQAQVAIQLVEFKFATHVHSVGRALPHWNLEAKKYPGRRMERGNPIVWPPRSLDITLLDFL
ncbi:hypothetical protein TNCV_4868351 [Trichonephila clavipes]|nr:hypothetical protein TNCV_4868351 [Trichonephila clavipes]